ncbi:Uncharacterised protein [Mycobacterium tuberculosis]|uniref:Uncharacterized protein n=1 Tax=Mycobacterium tuberculosis TaxID=1773 RepID=A0A916LA53_MYCTX|nr:Uncharacterised protein [Mycobacterium tuberculosis]
MATATRGPASAAVQRLQKAGIAARIPATAMVSQLSVTIGDIGLNAAPSAALPAAVVGSVIWPAWAPEQSMLRWLQANMASAATPYGRAANVAAVSVAVPCASDATSWGRKNCNAYSAKYRPP